MDILVVDNNLELCHQLVLFFNNQPDLNVVGEAHDGEEALLKIEELMPDLVILDLTMPHLDGLGVLERLRGLNLPKRPRIIVLTAFGKDELLTRLTHLGVDYFIVKPFNIHVLAERVRQFANTEEIDGASPRTKSMKIAPRDTLEQRVARELKKMGLSVHLKGYTYLREAVVLYLANGSIAGGLTKIVYPGLASRYQSTVSGVEAAIRNAVLAAWENGNSEYISEFVGAYQADKVPTNSVIIAKLAEEVQMHYEL